MAPVLRLLLLAAAVCSFLPPPAAQAAGPCSSTAVTIPVTALSHIYSRLSYSATQTVKLVLQKNMYLSAAIKLGAGFSCTIFTSAGGKASSPGGYIIGYSKPGPYPLVWVSDVSNVVITKITFQVPDSKPMCGQSDLGPEAGYGSALPCPALFVFRAWGVTVSHVAFNGGRLDVFRVTQSRIQASSFNLDVANLAGLRIGYAGDGPNLVKSQVVVENNKFRGGTEGVLLFRGAVGVTVRNNDFANHHFTAIQCGSGTSNVGDCMLNSYLQNYVEFEPGYAPLLDSSGFYFDTHWFNPGNYLSCNYVVRGRHCLYLDYTSSGVVVEGHVCAHNLDGVKINAGHSNLVSSVVTINHTECGGWMSCQNNDVNNCLPGRIGATWEAIRRSSLDSPAVRQAYPFMAAICKQTTARGLACNSGSVPASTSGACSGIPTDNSIQLSIVDSRRKAPWHEPKYTFCDGFPNVPKMNTLSYQYYYTAENVLPKGQVSPPWANVAFRDRAGGDFGLNPSSVIWKQYPGFKSCPRTKVGASQVADDAAFKYFSVWRTVPLSYT